MPLESDIGTLDLITLIKTFLHMNTQEEELLKVEPDLNNSGCLTEF